MTVGMKVIACYSFNPVFRMFMQLFFWYEINTETLIQQASFNFF